MDLTPATISPASIAPLDCQAANLATGRLGALETAFESLQNNMERDMRRLQGTVSRQEWRLQRLEHHARYCPGSGWRTSEAVIPGTQDAMDSLMTCDLEERHPTSGHQPVNQHGTQYPADRRDYPTSASYNNGHHGSTADPDYHQGREPDVKTTPAPPPDPSHQPQTPAVSSVFADPRPPPGEPALHPSRNTACSLYLTIASDYSGSYLDWHLHGQLVISSPPSNAVAGPSTLVAGSRNEGTSLVPPRNESWSPQYYGHDPPRR